MLCVHACLAFSSHMLVVVLVSHRPQRLNAPWVMCIAVCCLLTLVAKGRSGSTCRRCLRRTSRWCRRWMAAPPCTRPSTWAWPAKVRCGVYCRCVYVTCTTGNGPFLGHRNGEKKPYEWMSYNQVGCDYLLSMTVCVSVSVSPSLCQPVSVCLCLSLTLPFFCLSFALPDSLHIWTRLSPSLGHTARGVSVAQCTHVGEGHRKQRGVWTAEAWHQFAPELCCLEISSLL